MDKTILLISVSEFYYIADRCILYGYCKYIGGDISSVSEF